MTPLVEAIRQFLKEDGPRSPELIARGLRRLGRMVQIDLIERQLRENSFHFRPLGDGRWDLAENTADESSTVTDVEIVDPLLGLVEDFVAVDLETSGLDADRDEIVQVAAVRFSSGRPTRALNLHVKTHTPVRESLRVRMGWEEREAGELAEESSALVQLRDFVGSLPVVAWNAAFDIGFLHTRGLTFSRSIDALAVTMLVVPRGPHRLVATAQRLGIETEMPAQIPVVGSPISPQAHDALFDSHLAGAVYLAAASSLLSGVSKEVSSLLPELDLPVGSAPVHHEVERHTAPSSDPVENLSTIVTLLGRERRPAQEDLARITTRALEGASAIVEAPTGTGKTLGYVCGALALVARGSRVALVTAYKNLQDQLSDEIEHVLEAAGFNTTVAILKGGDNYICLRRLARARERLSEGPVDARFVLAVVQRLIDDDKTATVEDINWWLLERVPAARSILAELAVSCAHGECGRRLAIDLANRADIVILNQVMWLEPPSGLELPSASVLDEGHELENMATLAWTEEASAASLLTIANRLDPAGRPGLLETARRWLGDVSSARHLVRRLRAAVRSAHRPLLDFGRAIAPDVDLRNGGKVRFKRAPRMLHAGAWTRAEDGLRELRETLTSLSGELSAYLDAHLGDEIVAADIRDIAERCRTSEDLIGRLTAVLDASAVHFLDVGPEDRADWRLARAPVTVAAKLAERWEAQRGFMLVSATLQNGPHDFSFIVDRLGLRGKLAGGTHVIESDFPFDENVLLGVARWFNSIPTPRFMDEFRIETAEELISLARFGEGKTLGLFTSSARVTDAFASIVEPLAQAGIPVLAQGTGARPALLEEFRARVESVLLGTRSFWQGVDVPGASLSFVVIEKLPFPYMRDPVTEARLELLRRQGRNEFEDYLLPLATIGFKQGFGRLIRQRDDRGVVLILDRRFHAKGYQREVLGALPGFRPRRPDLEIDRHRFYESIADCFPGLIPDSSRSILEELPRSATKRDPPHVAEAGTREERRDQVLGALQALFGFDGFRSAEQEELFWRIVEKDDVIGLLPTGAGKSLPFQLAALVSTGLTLVVSPLIALMRDQVEQLLDKGIEAAGALVGNVSADERDEILRRCREGQIRLLYVSPERLRDPVFLEHVAGLDLRRVVVDEAHCVSLWGPSFRPDFLAIRPALDSCGKAGVPIAALTATATPQIEDDIRRVLRIEDATKVATPFGRPELRLAVLGPDTRLRGDRIRNRKERIRLLMRILTAAERRGEAAIVYVPTVAQAEQITSQLRMVGILARSYHGRMDAWTRQSVEDLFREGEIDVVVATKAFGMGIDRPDIRYVIHVGFPADLESYYQEAGRAGRDGTSSFCLLLALPTDRGTQEWFIDQVAELDVVLSDAWTDLKARGAGVHLLDLEAWAGQLGLEETQGRVILHYLEEAGAVKRESDRTIRASLLLLEQPSDPIVLNAIGSTVEPLVRTEISTEDLAVRAGMAGPELERRLVAESRAGTLVYRPIRRFAAVLVKPDELVSAPDTSVVVAAMRKKLDEMEQFANVSSCRQATIRRYLGETAPPACGVCDVCDTSMPRPWLEATLDSVPDPDVLVDEELVLLGAIDWNASELRSGRSPYGVGALLSVVCGDSYSLGRYVTGSARSPRIRRAQGSPYWAGLAMVTNSRAAAERAVERLEGRGLIERRAHSATMAGAEQISYEYYKVTEAGMARLQSGAFS